MSNGSNYKQRLTQNAAFPTIESLRLFVYAAPGCGKTSFLGSIPSSVLLDVEGEGGFLLGPAAKVLTLKDGEDLEGAITWLCEEGPQGTGYARVSIDTIDAFYRMAIPWFTEKFNRDARTKAGNRKDYKDVPDIRQWGMHGAGASRLNEYILAQIINLRLAGYGLSISGHTVAKEIEVKTAQGSQTKIKIRPVISDGLRIPLYRFSQFCGNLSYRTESIPQQLRSGHTTTVKARRYRMNLSEESGGTDQDTNMKARLIPFMQDPATQTIIVDVTGPKGWAAFAERYTEACTRAMKSLLTKTGEEKTNDDQ